MGTSPGTARTSGLPLLPVGPGTGGPLTAAGTTVPDGGLRAPDAGAGAGLLTAAAGLLIEDPLTGGLPTEDLQTEDLQTEDLALPTLLEKRELKGVSADLPVDVHDPN